MHACRQHNRHRSMENDTAPLSQRQSRNLLSMGTVVYSSQHQKGRWSTGAGTEVTRCIWSGAIATTQRSSLSLDLLRSLCLELRCLLLSLDSRLSLDLSRLLCLLLRCLSLSEASL